MSYYPNHNMPPCGRPPQHPFIFGDLNYTAEQINVLLGMIPFKADRAEVPEMEKLSDVNYLGHVADPSLLTHQTQPSWALVGSLKAARPYFYYVEGFVPQGYTAGWNDVSSVLGTYDLTSDKVSIYDFHLLTEYNVSRNHVHSTRVFSKDWGITSKYYSEFADYVPGQHYAACSKVNMPGYKEHSFMANKATKEAPFITVDETNEFSFSEAVALVPEEYRFPGMRVTFINSMTRLAETWYFKGGTWENVGNWQKINFGVGEDQLTAEELFKEKFEMPKLISDMAIADEHGNRIPDTYVKRQAVANYIKSVYQELFIANPPLIMEGYITPEMLSEAVKDMLAEAGATITNLPDEEDLTKIHGVLKLANKQHNPNAYSGLGRTYLRKNMVGGVNVLTQSMMQWPNTIYIIQYDYDLNGAEIKVPEGCVLDFQGGRITDGTIKLSNTRILQNGCVITDYITANITGNYAIGQCLFDINISKPKYWTGTKWVDATGTEV